MAKLELVARSAPPPPPSPRDAIGAPAPAPTSAERAAHALLEQREAVITELETEIEKQKEAATAILSHVRHLEDVLARVRGAAHEAPQRATVYEKLVEQDELDLTNASISEAIWFAVAAHPRGIDASGIQEWLANRGKKITPKYCHTYIHRMLGDGRLVHQGEAGSRRYLMGRPKDYRLPKIAPSATDTAEDE